MIKLDYESLIAVIKNKKNSDKIIRILLSKDSEKIICYKYLYRESKKILGGLQKAGLKRGDELILQFSEIEPFIYSFWACLLGGIIPIPVTLATSREGIRKLLNIWKQMNNPFVITRTNAIKIEKEYGIDEVYITEIYNKTIVYDKLQANDDGIEYKALGEQIAYVQYSSGSTGTPKGVVITHSNLLTNIYAIIKGIEVSIHDRVLSWMPLTHDMGLIGMHLCPLVGDFEQILMTPQMFIKNPLNWLKLIEKYKATIISSPNFGYKYTLGRLKDKLNCELDLSSIRLIFNGAEPISFDLCNRFINFMEKFGLKKNAMFPVYGMAEASLAISFSEVNNEVEAIYLNRDEIAIGGKIQICDNENAAIFVKLGYPVASVEVCIRDEQNNNLIENTIGIIFIRGDSVTKGYYNKNKILTSVIDNEGWLNTGDIGFINENKIVVIGRQKELIIINGFNYYCSDLERVAYMALSGESKAELAICGHDGHNTLDEIILFIKLKCNQTDYSKIKKDIKAVFQRETRLRIDKVIEVPFFPKTTSGKIRRYELIRNYEEGQYEN